MKTSSLLAIVLGIVLVVSLVTIWFYPSIQDFTAGNTMWNGLKGFKDRFDAIELDSLENLTDSPEKKVLVSIPYNEYDYEDLVKIKDFVNEGGTLVMLDDFGYGNGVLEYLGLPARYNHNLLTDPLFCYKIPTLPRITEFTSGVKESGVEAIAFNRGSVLDNVNEAHAVAWSSDLSFLDLNQNGAMDSGEPEGPFAVAAEYTLGKGTVELVSDPSLIINAMVEQNDNYAFTHYLINRNGQPQEVLLDRGHLPRAPLDTSKQSLAELLLILSNPYALIGVIAVVFLIVTRYTLKRGAAV